MVVNISVITYIGSLCIYTVHRIAAKSSATVHPFLHFLIIHWQNLAYDWGITGHSRLEGDGICMPALGL